MREAGDGDTHSCFSYSIPEVQSKPVFAECISLCFQSKTVFSERIEQHLSLNSKNDSRII